IVVQAAGFGAELQRTTAAQWPLDAGVALINFAGRVRHVALVAFDDDADAVIHAEYPQIDVTVTVDGQAGDAHFQVRVAGHAVMQGQAALELPERCVLAPRCTAEGFVIERGNAVAELLLEVGVEQYAIVDEEAGGAVEAV